MRRKLGVVAAAFALAATMATTVSASAIPPQYPEYHVYFESHRIDMPLVKDRWVPQGLTKWGEDRLIISYYDRFETTWSRIAIVDRATGARIKWLRLDTKGHVGGLAKTKEWLWVATSGHVYRYSHRQLSKPTGKMMLRGYDKDVKGKASYAYAEGENVWVGNFDAGDDPQWMYRYSITSDDKLTYEEDRRTPSKVQGVALTPTKIIWSTSHGRKNDSTLIVWKRDEAYDEDDDQYGNEIVAPPMTQGLAIANGKLFVDYESCSDKYNGSANDGKGRASVIICKLHYGTIPSWSD